MPGIALEQKTFLFTDIEGSTRLWESNPDGMRVALARHDALMKSAIESAGGTVFKTVGDAFCAVFPDPIQGVDAATRAQLALHEAFADGPIRIRVRMALHHGDAEHRDDDFFGQALNHVARVLSAGHGGQVLATDSVRDRAGANRFRSLGRHRLKDIEHPVALHQLTVAELPDHFPALRTLDSVPLLGNLPEPRSEMVGRAALRHQLMEVVRPGSVTTLLGPGGTGKTRLALDLALRIRDRFPQGVWWVDLEPVRDGDDVPAVVATALGVREEPGQSIATTVANSLANKTVLIVLDNCEHLLDSVAQMIETFRRSVSTLAVLASSREALGLAGEQRTPVPPLSLPPAGDNPAPQVVADSEAARLFVDRARLFHSDFTIDSNNAAAVASICRRLDGIPLAIELAAARVRALSVDQIDQRLDKRLRLLTGGSRSSAPRQQTLRALIDWSHELLGDDDRALFRRLAVFQGGWTLEAAETICAEVDGHWVDVVDGLTSLVDKSLAVVEQSPSQVRYRMLETIREYASERLDGSADAEAVAVGHGRYFSELVESGVDAANERWLAAIDSDYANILAVLERASPAMATGTALGLEEYWHRRGLWTQACEHLAAVSARCGTPDGRARLIGIEGWFRYLRGESAAARVRSTEALAIAVLAEDHEGESLARNTLAFLDWQKGDTDAARDGFERSLGLLRGLGDQRRQAGRLSNLGLLATVTRDWERARLFLEEAMLMYQAVGDPQGIGSCCCNLADLDLSSGNPTAALHHARSGLRHFEDCHDLPGMVYSLANVAEAELRLGNAREADQAAEDALGRCSQSEMPLLAPLLLELRVRACATLGDRASATVLLTEADAARARIDAPRDPNLQEELDILLGTAVRNDQETTGTAETTAPDED